MTTERNLEQTIQETAGLEPLVTHNFNNDRVRIINEHLYATHEWHYGYKVFNDEGKEVASGGRMTAFANGEFKTNGAWGEEILYDKQGKEKAKGKDIESHDNGMYSLRDENNDTILYDADHNELHRGRSIAVLDEGHVRVSGKNEDIVYDKQQKPFLTGTDIGYWNGNFIVREPDEYTVVDMQKTILYQGSDRDAAEKFLSGPDKKEQRTVTKNMPFQRRGAQTLVDTRTNEVYKANNFWLLNENVFLAEKGDNITLYDTRKSQ